MPTAAAHSQHNLFATTLDPLGRAPPERSPRDFYAHSTSPQAATVQATMDALAHLSSPVRFSSLTSAAPVTHSVAHSLTKLTADRSSKIGSDRGSIRRRLNEDYDYQEVSAPSNSVRPASSSSSGFLPPEQWELCSSEVFNPTKVTPGFAFQSGLLSYDNLSFQGFVHGSLGLIAVGADEKLFPAQLSSTYCKLFLASSLSEACSWFQHQVQQAHRRAPAFGHIGASGLPPPLPGLREWPAKVIDAFRKADWRGGNLHEAFLPTNDEFSAYSLLLA